MNAISLFSGAGIGEYYLHKLGIDIILANELIRKRAETHMVLYPNCKMLTADITKKETQNEIIAFGRRNNIKLIIATPPCQGRSTAGRTKSA